jgi:DNA helicase-2/ATP-dependent DNA helicase PcrA
MEQPEYAIILQNNPRTDTFFANCISMISEQKRALVSPEACNLEEPFPGIYRKYNDALASQNAMDFDDILFYSYRILTENLDVVKLYNSVYRFVCVDESQDLNSAQYQVIQALCGDDFHNIMMVGDENQSIYAFNGSSSKYMSELFVRDFNPTIFTLEENFRSAKQIIKFANNLTGSKDDISKYFYEGELLINSYPNELDEAVAVRTLIENLIINGHKDIENDLDYGGFAIIARNKYVFSKIEEELINAGIPFYYKKTLSGIACETDYMEAFDLILRLLMNPRDMYHRLILCKLTSTEIISLENCDDTNKLIEQLLSHTQYSWLNSILSTVTTNGPINFDKVLDVLKNEMPSHLSDDERYLLENDIDEWKKHWNKFKSQVASEYRSLVAFRNAISLGKTRNVETDSGVALLTAHMSKGLEFEVVFVIGLTEGTFPDYRAVNNDGEAMVQEKNNMYVAATRAKRLCYLSYPEIKRMPRGGDRRQSPSRFIVNYSNN